MIVVIIAGGLGTRLWPLSTPEYPKHLLKINGHNKSLLQNTYERAKKLSNNIYVITEAGHAHHVRDQLPKLSDKHIIIEPARRGTASCIIAGLEKMRRYHDKDEPIAFMAADHYVRDEKGFAHSFLIASKVSKKKGNIVLVGVEPDSAATGFGYIEKGGLFDENLFVYEVKRFKEKPDYYTAKKYFESGKYLWNCSYFVASISTFLAAMKKYSPKMYDNYQSLAASSEYEKTYLGFENIAIDYALIEKTKDLLVVPASFDWMDLGSYDDLHKAIGGNEQGNFIGGEAVETIDVENSFIQNYGGKPVVVIGLDNVVVVNTESGILVARKDLSQKVGEASKRYTSKLTNINELCFCHKLI